MGKRLFNFYGKPELIISSGAVRALTTAKFFANTCEYPIENIQINDHLYLASSRKIVEIIQSIDNQFSNVWLFSHNPAISETIFELSDRDVELKTCCIVVIEKDTKKWSKIQKGNCHIVNHMTPKDNQN